MKDATHGLSAYQRIQQAKLDYAKKEAAKIDWTEIEDSLVTQWYAVSKIMGVIIPKTFPYLTFQGLTEEIGKDPNFKKHEE